MGIVWVLVGALVLAAVGGGIAAVFHSLRRAAAADARERELRAEHLDLQQKCKQLEDRLRPITSVERRAEEIKKQLAEEIQVERAVQRDLADAIAALRRRHAVVMKAVADADQAMLERDRDAEDLLAGFHPPSRRFDSSEAYKDEIAQLRDRLKAARKSGEAWTQLPPQPTPADEKATDRAAKNLRVLMLRAFNAEADLALSRLTWRNLESMKSLVERAWKDINVAGDYFRIALSPMVRAERLRELELASELEIQRHEEEEEQREIRAQQREEAREQRELERAQQQAELEERVRARALEEARAALAEASAAERAILERRVAEAEAALADAQRAVSQAQLTRRGHVYVISNIGSFGEDVYKIGLTRRLDPQERIDELSDASVPFDFDVHAFIASDDAPALESSFHRELESSRMNLVNLRREFFHVTIEQIEEVAQRLGVKLELTRVAEARQFRESLVKRGLSPETIRWKDELAATRAATGTTPNNPR
ncbi:MAG: DUF4041 domain-containing protein [Phycisphaerales bacterium]